MTRLLTGLAAGLLLGLATDIARRSTRVRGAGNILAGHPTAYRIHIKDGGILLDGDVHGYIAECFIEGAARAISIWKAATE